MFQSIESFPLQRKLSGKVRMIFHSMVDMDQNNMTCGYCTLLYICRLCLKIKGIPVVTSDLPLLLKALAVIESASGSDDLKKVVLQLGSFHTIMSFIGPVGHIISGSELEDLLSTVYAPHTVCSMLMDKAVARALRGLFLVETALHTRLALEALGLPMETLSL